MSLQSQYRRKRADYGQTCPVEVSACLASVTDLVMVYSIAVRVNNYDLDQSPYFGHRLCGLVSTAELGLWDTSHSAFEERADPLREDPDENLGEAEVRPRVASEREVSGVRPAEVEGLSASLSFAMPFEVVG